MLLIYTVNIINNYNYVDIILLLLKNETVKDDMKKRTESIKLFFIKSNIISISILIVLVFIFIYNTASTLLINSYNKKLTETLETAAVFIEQNIEIAAVNIINYLEKNNSILNRLTIENKLLELHRFNTNFITASGIIKGETYFTDNSGIKPADLSAFTVSSSQINNFNNIFFLTNLNMFIKKDKPSFQAVSIVIPDYLENTYIVFLIDSSYLRQITSKLIYNMSDFKEIRFNDRKNQNIFSVKHNNKDTMLDTKIFTHTTKNGFILTLEADYSQMDKDIAKLKISLIVMLLFYTIFILIQKSILSSKIYLPIKRMIELMSYIGMGHFDIKLIDRSWREIELLSGQIDIMIKKINSLSKEIYSNKLLTVQTEIRTLQSQINPHFLFNTLNTMKMMAVKNKTENTIKIINLLSEMLHYGIYDANRTVPIAEELKNIETYIKIIEYRFNKTISLSINCPEELLKKQTLKLILQPVIENSIKHGFSDIGSAKISITVLKEYTTIIFIIKDNGNGISENTLKQLLKFLKDRNISDHSSSIGLINVKNRITLKYGTQYGLEIYSSEASGTTIKISIEDLI